MIPSRYPVAGLLDRVASPADLDALFELEGWTNDRISNELGLLHTVPESEWVDGSADGDRGDGRVLPPASGRRPLLDRRARRLVRGHGRLPPRWPSRCITGRRSCARLAASRRPSQMRVYLADFRARFHDVRPAHAAWAPLYDPDDYSASQVLDQRLLDAGSNGVVYRIRPRSGRRVPRLLPPGAGPQRPRRRPLRVSLGGPAGAGDPEALDACYT